MHWAVGCLLCMWVGLAHGGYNFLAIGDWGGQDASPYTTKGEVGNAKAMGDVAETVNSKYVLAMGDNFYSSGIHGSAKDPRFKETFEDVFTASSLQTPWYAIAGNHDHKGNVSAQIEYTKLSSRWKYPDYWYSFSDVFEDGGKTVTVETLMVDTVLLSGESYFDEERQVAVKPTGPLDAKLAASQWDWIESTLKASTADYLFVSGHYPVWSVCSHGPTQDLVDKLKPMMLKYNVTAYLCGHDHCSEYLDDGGVTKYILAGAGHDCCYDPSHMKDVPTGSLKFHKAGDNKGSMLGGFAALNLTATGAVATFYDTAGEVQYTTPTMKPRK